MTKEVKNNVLVIHAKHHEEDETFKSILAKYSKDKIYLCLPGRVGELKDKGYKNVQVSKKNVVIEDDSVDGNQLVVMVKLLPKPKKEEPKKDSKKD